jgi:hypothetical protein
MQVDRRKGAMGTQGKVNMGVTIKEQRRTRIAQKVKRV